MYNVETALQKVVDFFTEHQNRIVRLMKNGLARDEHTAWNHFARKVELCGKLTVELWKKHTQQPLDDQEIKALTNLEHIEHDDPEIGLLRQMMNIGFVAAVNGFCTEAQEIFRGVGAMRAGSELPLIGVAMAQMNAGDLNGAVSTLNDQALNINPDSEYAKSYLAMAYKMSNMKEEFESLANEVIKCGKDPASVRMVKKLALSEDVQTAPLCPVLESPPVAASRQVCR